MAATRSRSSSTRGRDPRIVAGVVALALFGGLGFWAWSRSSPAPTDKAARSTPSRGNLRKKLPDPSPDRTGEADTTVPEMTVGNRSQKTQENRRPRGAATDQPTAESFLVVVETTEPGFRVEVDGILARDNTGEPLVTPCEISLAPGPRSFRLARRSYRDITREVVVIENETISLEAVYDPFGEPTGYFASPFHEVAVGQSVVIPQLLAGGLPQSPWLSQDGLDLWFAGEGSPGRGVFHARRNHTDLAFETSTLVQRTSEAVTSPVATQDGLLVAFVNPNQRQVRSLVRSENTDPFRPGPPLLFEEDGTERWPAVALSPEGRQLFVLTERGNRQRIRTANRRGESPEFAFAKGAQETPGNTPRLSADGTTWYWIDEGSILKSPRGDSKTPFGPPTRLCDLPPEMATQAANWPGFCLSHDEQWLWHPEGEGETAALVAVRIQAAPTHGPRLIGRPRSATAIAAKPEPSPAAETSSPGMSEVTPAPEPLFTYPAFRRQLADLLLIGNLDDADQLWQKARQQMSEPSIAATLKDDEIDLQLARGFWQRLGEAVTALKPGDKLRLGGSNRVISQVTPDDWSVVTRSNSGQERKWELKELPPLELVAIADRITGSGTSDVPLQSAGFLLLAEQAETSEFRNRLLRAGPAQADFLARWNARELLELKLEAEAGNLSQARRLVERLVKRSPQSAEANAAREELALFPQRMKWTPKGGQQWQQISPDTWEPQQPRAPGGYLASARQYRNFRVMLDWRTTEPTAHGGVFFRYAGTGPLRQNAWKLQLANDAGLTTPDRFSTGALFGIKPPVANRTRPAGEWNTLELEVKGDRAIARINGEPALDAVLNDPNIPERGEVCLDGEFRGISYRGVIIEPLPDTE